jgi:hypothetical protein
MRSYIRIIVTVLRCVEVHVHSRPWIIDHMPILSHNSQITLQTVQWQRF